jgi:uncharacterized integral membrane protein
MNSPQSRPQQPNAAEQGGPAYGSPADAYGTSPTGFDPAGYEVERSDFNMTAPVGPVGAGSPPPNASPYPVAYPDQNFPSGNPAIDNSAPDSSTAPKSGSISSGQPLRRHSRAGAAWVALIVAAIVLIFLLIFVVQNSGPVQISYFGFEGTLSLGVAMIFAAIAGALTAGLLGTVRILQLRARARRAAAGK